jgi:aminoglycoside phosphotransferase (APT) family kinase protein
MTSVWNVASVTSIDMAKNDTGDISAPGGDADSRGMSLPCGDMEHASTATTGALPGIDVEPLSAWLGANIPGAAAPFTFDVVAGGHSNLTYVVTSSTGSRFVLRRPPLGHVLPSAHDMGREHRIISALAPTPVPVAPALAYCDDLAVNGAPFYVMGFVDGLVLRDVHQAENSLSVEARGAASQSIVDTLAAIHAVDLSAVGLDDLGRHDGYIARQLKRWYGQWNAQKTRELSEVDHVHEALSTRIPDQGPASIVHGDYRLDNCMLHRDGTVAAVLDWEICTLGDPLADIGMLQVYWTGPDDQDTAWTGSATKAPGFANRAELLDRYAEVSGRDLSSIDFYVAFAYWKLACILEGVYARYLGGALGERDTSAYDVFKVQVERAAAQSAEYAERL